MCLRFSALLLGLTLLSAPASVGAQSYCNNCSLDTDGNGVVAFGDCLACLGFAVPGAPIPVCDLWDLNNNGIIDIFGPADCNLWLACGHNCVECGAECFSHFNAYDIPSGPDGPLVTLEDQFQTQVVDLGAANLLLAPVDKNSEGIPDPFTGLVCYSIPSGDPAPPTVIATNQFGSQTLDLTDPVELCVPSTGPSEPLGSLDHYKCYEASGSVIPGPVDLLDNFHALQSASQTVSDLTPDLFCNPVDKNSEGIIEESRHLTCYTYTPAGLTPPGPVPIVNQFGQASLTASTPARLCVPSKLPIAAPALSRPGIVALATALLAMAAFAAVRRRRS